MAPEDSSEPATTVESAPAPRASDAETIVGTAGSARRPGATRQVERGDAIGRYVVLGRLGAGSMGVVYSAYDPELDRRIAIKLLRFEPEDDDGGARLGLFREAQAMARITHPNVVTVHDVGAQDGRVYLAMEFIDGQTLRAWSTAATRSWREVVDVFVHAGHGLRAAHEQGLVHRDFKPDNVMVASGGRVVVMDFGLAQGERQHAVAPDEVLSSGRSVVATLASSATAAPEIAGTPAYMSPEQLAGSTADARSDQFSFCVALFEALFGVPPFSARRLPELAYAIASGSIREVPPGSSVPPFVRRAVERGLAPDPVHRWPSIDALLRALDDRDVRRRRARITGVSAVLGAGAIATAAWWSTRGPEPCSGAPARLVGVWDDARHAEVDAVVVALDAPWASTAIGAATTRLDAYAREWIESHTEACRATTVFGAQSPALMDLRIACLERARMDLQAAAEQLATADPEVLAHAHRLTAELPELASCADVERLDDEAAPPLDPAEAAEHTALQQALASGRAAYAAGRYAAAEADLLELRERIDATGHRPLQAESLVALARARAQLGRSAAARIDAEDALRLALAAERPDLAGRAARVLVSIVAGDERKPAEGLIYANVGLGLALRVDEPRALTAAHSALGAAHSVAGSTHEAERHLRRALELDPRDDAVETGHLLQGLGDALLGAGRADEGIAQLREGCRVLEAALGPEHPDLATIHQSLGNALFVVGRHAEADVEFRRGLSISTAALGEDHPSSIAARFGLASQLAVAERHAEAELELESLLLTVSRTMGPGSARAAFVRSNLAAVLEAAGRYADAEAEARRALDVFARTLGDEHGDAAPARSTLGRSLAAQGRHAEATIEYRRAIVLRERSLGPEHRQVGKELMRLAGSLEALGHTAEATASLERAVRIFEHHVEATPVDLARARFALAKATADSVGARALAEAAIEHLPARERADAESWLGKRTP